MKDKKNLVLAIIIACFAVLLVAAPFITGPSTRVPRVLHGTWSSDAVTLTFSGSEDVKAVCGDKTAQFTYINGTTGTNLVIWFQLGDGCPEEFKFLDSSRENYLIYSNGSDENGEYMEIGAVKYYKQS